MMITHKLNMDLQNRNIQQRLTMAQNDTGSRAVMLALTSGGVAWMPEELDNVIFRYRKSDGTGGSYDTLPDGTKAWESEGNTVTILMAPQVLTVPGLVEAQAALMYDDQQVATFTFQIVVEADPSLDAVVSEDYVNWSQWAKAELDIRLEEAKENGDFAGPVFFPAVDEQANLSWTNNGGLENPEPVNIADLVAENLNGDILQGNMVGNLNMNGYRIMALDAPSAQDDAATKGYALGLVKKAAPRNLLDNSDFQNPVNQRGSSGYSGNAYCIDRWYTENGSMSLSVNSGYITVSNADTVSAGRFGQKTLELNGYDGPVTLAVYLKDGAVLLGTAQCDSGAVSGSVPIFLASDNNYGIGTVLEHHGSCKGIVLNIDAECSADLLHAALYQGTYTAEELPEYQSKGYAAEYANCCRCFYVIPRYQVLNGFITGSGKEIWTTIFLPASMRLLSPTVTSLPEVIIRTVSGYSSLTPSTNDAIVPTSGAATAESLHTGGMVRIRFYFDAAVGANNTVVSVFMNSKAFVSADL